MATVASLTGVGQVVSKEVRKLESKSGKPWVFNEVKIACLGCEITMRVDDDNVFASFPVVGSECLFEARVVQGARLGFVLKTFEAR